MADSLSWKSAGNTAFIASLFCLYVANTTTFEFLLMTRLQEILQSKSRPELLSLAKLLDIHIVTLYRWRKGTAYPAGESRRKLLALFADILDHNGIYESCQGSGREH